MIDKKFIGVVLFDFIKTFKADEDCMEYLSSIKWADGYRCKKCGNTNFCKGRKPFSRRCTRCKYDESPTVNTMFDKCKFPLLTAFHIAFKISTKKKGMSTLELHREFGLRQKTCWNFKKKIQIIMKSSQRFPLTGEVHVDEFFIGGPEKNMQGRGAEKKRLVVIAIEKVADGIGRAYGEVIENASSKALLPFFRSYIKPNTKILTDEWNGYKPLLKEYPNMLQIPSDKGNNFPDLHIHIMNLKGWLRGIHHHCSKEHLQGYLDEFHFRHNRRNNMDTIFHKLIERMVNKKLIC
ncbi:MAG: IS1595 family transposase [Bacteroidales bacterium]|nr:IS1595 family transposase [Bacteroidales bacterium]